MAQLYTVVEGDTLWAIAIRFYGDGTAFAVIAAENRIPDPNHIVPGQVLRIPELPAPPMPPPPAPATITFRLLRPADLVDLRCAAHEFAFATDHRPTVATHVVAEGDTLWDLATRFYGDGTKFTLIAAANHLADPGLIFPGQELIIPDLAAPAAEQVHEVVGGDTLWDLAARFYGDPTLFPLIAAANGIGDPHRIHPGQRLVIPDVRPAEPGTPRIPRLVAVGDDAHLIVRFGSQNLLEQRFGAAPGVVARILAAHDSRVVFAVAKGTEIPFTTAGVLAALRTFPLRVPARALPAGERGEPGVPVPPEPDRTAIEAPFRLVVSPSRLGGFTHSPGIGSAPGDPGRTELWTTLLGVRTERDGQFADVDPDAADQRIVRAVWTRDADPGVTDPGFDASLTPSDRHWIVRQTSETGIRNAADVPVEPAPLTVRRLRLSAVGAWVDWSGRWNDEDYRSAPPPPGALPGPLVAYRHSAPMGRDAYVRVEKAGYLFPFGHRVTLVKVTERRIGGGPDPVAFLLQRSFIVVRERTRDYGAATRRRLPFGTVSIDPPVTPDLAPLPEGPQVTVPRIGGEPYRWTVTGIDHEGRPITLSMPLVLVVPGRTVTATATILAAWPPELRRVPVGDVAVAMAPPSTPGDTTLAVHALDFTGVADPDPPRATSTPAMARAFVTIPALDTIGRPRGPVETRYAEGYATSDFDANAQVFLTLADRQTLSFAGGADRAGGFVEPSVAVAALSRRLGAIGDEAGAAAGTLDPATFLAGALPKLFGLFSLVELVDSAGLGEAPALIAERLDVLGSLGAEFTRFTGALDRAGAELGDDIAHAANAAASGRAEALRTLVDAARAGSAGADEQLGAALRAVLDGQADEAAAAAGAFRATLSAVDPVLADPALPAALRAALHKPVAALRRIADLTQGSELLAALRAPFASNVLRFEWQPRLKNWSPPGVNADTDPVFKPRPDGLVIAVEVRTTERGEPAVDISAQLRAFELILMPGAPLLSMRFGRLGFRVDGARKPEIDVVFDRLEFLGALSFIEKIRQLIPFDGFADPPYVDIAADGVTAGFDLALPSVAVGVFGLANITLSADCRIPFLGAAVTVGFGFCRKDSPFRLTVMCIGGGGWVELRLSPAKMVVLEMGLEACACLAVDLGVASGSVSVSIGVYLRLENGTGQLTGYFRIRGEVDVLGLISACITLELSLTYHFRSGKLIGRASLTVEVEVLFFSASVEIVCERQLAGSKGDPTLRDIMPPESGGHDMWNHYLDSFAIGA
ncbi:LysM peptidoglycan-binding domain-containing protein [Nocardia jiangsuensis]|uniref:LysM peptidoglycan-binding domain-containing protein n=1 Tax=Nocardia jiangsuensis TaxID=1691563 RepID=A0ABV8E1D8_9NOCA